VSSSLGLAAGRVWADALRFPAAPYLGGAPAGFRLQRKPGPSGRVSTDGRNRLESEASAHTLDSDSKVVGREPDAEGCGVAEMR
jgi:hypothetical protein